MSVTDFDYEKGVFSLEGEPWNPGSWWWWFWLFFFDNPLDPSRPRQLMILWSTKNVDEIDCNDYKISMGHKSGPGRLDGAVAAWYFDGEVMQHNYLLEKGVVELSEDRLDFKSSQPSSFEVDKGLNRIRIGDDFKFNASFNQESTLD